MHRLLVTTLILTAAFSGGFFALTPVARAQQCPPNTHLQTIQTSGIDQTGLAIPSTVCVSDTDTSGGVGASVQTMANATPPKAAPGECSFSGGYTFEGCIWIPLMSWLGSWFLTVGGGLLRLAGILFDTLTYSVIINFKGTLTSLHITDAIDNGWTIFRDFSNILIIGIFVFIAISIILGLKEFGQKKLIANVLIIAVLINFSLLFTKIIIDGSNFAAFQIYKQMAGGTVGTDASSFDIAGGFLRPMGMTSVWSDSALVTAAVGKSTSSALQAFMFGLIGGLLLLVAALVLFYGCFLIIARAILFIFLMLTAALAFATYLVPSLAHGEYGWSSWWKALFNNAIFAPLVMLFLAVSLTIVNAAGQSINTSDGATTLGSIIANPTQNVSAWGVMLTYIIGIGLLFLSFRMASKFAGTISGFNLAAAIPAYGLGVLGRVGGVLGRQAIGRPALNIGDRLQNRSGQTTGLARSLYDFGAQKFKGVAKSDFNAMRTGFGSAVAGAAGKKVDDIVGKSIGGFVGSQNATLKRIAETARRTKPDDDTKKAGQEDAKNQLTRANTDAAYKAAMAENLHRDRTADHQSLEKQLEEFTQQSERNINEMRKGLSAAFEKVQRNPSDTGAQADLQRIRREVQTAEQQQRQQISEQSENIKRAKTLTDKAATNVVSVDKTLNKMAKEAGYNEWAYKDAGDRAKEMAGGFTALLHATGVSKKSREAFAKKAAKEAGKQEQKHHFQEKYGDALKAMLKDDGHDDAHKPAPKPAATDAHDEHHD